MNMDEFECPAETKTPCAPRDRVAGKNWSKWNLKRLKQLY